MIYFTTSEGKSLEQNLLAQLQLLASTPVGSVMLMRDFGIDMSFLDMPPAEAQVMMAAELAEKIETYISNITLDRVELTAADGSGAFHFKVVVRGV